MDKLINGNSLKIQFGNETTYGTAATAYPIQVQVSEEGFKWVAEKKDEGLLTGGKSTGRISTMVSKVEGSITTLARPNELEYFLAKACGVETVATDTGVSTHTFTTIGTALNDKLPSISANVDRTVEVDCYFGLKVSKISLDASAGDYVKASYEFVGFDENTSATWVAGSSLSPIPAFRFSHGKFKLAGTEIEVSSAKLEIDNAIENKVQTSMSGSHYREPDCGARKITTEFELVYSTAAEAIRKNYYKKDDVFALELTYVSDTMIIDDKPYELKIVIPANQAPETTHNTSGADAQKMTLKCQAIENGIDELITIACKNARPTAY